MLISILPDNRCPRQCFRAFLPSEGLSRARNNNFAYDGRFLSNFDIWVLIFMFFHTGKSISGHKKRLRGLIFHLEGLSGCPKVLDRVRNNYFTYLGCFLSNFGIWVLIFIFCQAGKSISRHQKWLGGFILHLEGLLGCTEVLYFAYLGFSYPIPLREASPVSCVHWDYLLRRCVKHLLYHESSLVSCVGWE